MNNSKQKFAKLFLPNQTLAKKRLKNNTDIVYDSFKINDEFKKIGINKKAYVRTYGCQSNIRDTESINGILLACGYSLTKDQAQADVIILNTCAIRENAEQKIFGEIGHLKGQVRHKQTLIGVCGCMVQQEHIAKKILAENKHISFAFGTHNIHMLPQILFDLQTQDKNFCIFSEHGKVYENLPVEYDSKVKCFVNITYGCDKFCTYCVVPFVRGGFRSRKKEDIINEINNLIQKGYKEITLIGQNVNSYGVDIYENYFFKDLLIDVAKTNIPRVRFTTSNPWNFNNEIISVMKQYDNIMPHVHLPIQSGDENILKAMNRGMKINDYIRLIKNLRIELGDVGISTDIIVGFPNETADQFKNTLSLYKLIKFDNAYTFIFSPRVGTQAARIIDKTRLNTKQKRLMLLNNLVRKYAKWNCDKYIGKTVKVLIEGMSKTNKKMLTGYSPQWKVVNFSGSGKIGDIVDVKILTSSRFSLNGVQV